MNGSQRIDTQLEMWSQRQPDAWAIIEAAGQKKQVSYGDLSQAVKALQAYLGVQPQTVVIALPGSIETAVVWLGCLCAGHLLVPISPDVTDTEYQQIIDVHQPEIVITDRQGHKQSAATKILTSLQLRHLIQRSNLANDEPTVPTREGSVYLSTSGSTGTPKGIVLSASQCVMTAKYIISSHKLTHNDRGLTPLPFHHVNAPMVSLLTTVLSGGCLIIAPKYSTAQFWQWVADYDPTWISLVPTMIAMLLTTTRPTFLDTAALRFIRTASAPLAPSMLRDFEAAFKIPLIETYGLSEAASTIAANPVPPGIHKAGSVGLPVGVELHVFEPETGNQLASGKTGEVRIRGANVISSYVGNDDSAAFTDGWFRTGDLGYIDDDGYLFLTGRSKDVIIRGGENIFPREIEEVLISFPAISEAIVVGHPDSLYGEKIVAFVTMAETDKTASESLIAELKVYMQQHVSRQKVPAEFHVLAEFPKTKAGKVDKPRLRQPSI